MSKQFKSLLIILIITVFSLFFIAQLSYSQILLVGLAGDIGISNSYSAIYFDSGFIFFPFINQETLSFSSFTLNFGIGYPIGSTLYLQGGLLYNSALSLFYFF